MNHNFKLLPQFEAMFARLPHRVYFYLVGDEMMPINVRTCDQGLFLAGWCFDDEDEQIWCSFVPFHLGKIFWQGTVLFGPNAGVRYHAVPSEFICLGVPENEWD